MTANNASNKALLPPRIFWIPVFLLALVSLGVLWFYSQTSISSGEGHFLLPVDDVYIHFQYARQIASGSPYVYNPGLPPTSGATSFIYPYLLASGYALGFTGLNLALWAMMLGTLALFLSSYVIFRFAQDLELSPVVGLIVALAFTLTGAVSWHFMSGMETGLAVMLSLLTLWTFITRRRTGFVLFATLLTLTRPEGGLLALALTGVYLLREWYSYPQPFAVVTLAKLGKTQAILLLPILAFSVQPAVNYLVTGSASASGNQAKSLLGIIPNYPDIIIQRVLENFLRAWREFATGIGEHDIWFLPPLFGLVAFLGLLTYSVRRRRYDVFLGVLGALLIGFAAISSLDTAFWHFKRYHMPLLVWVFPLSLLALTMIPRERIRLLVVLTVLGLSAYSAPAFLHYFGLNVTNVYQQPYSMALWLRENTDERVVVAVHDVGLMRYFGERTTLDMVGLTTPNATDYWRNGPGAVAEFLLNEKPDLVAAYTTARGLGYLADTPIYGDLLEGFTANFDAAYNVALGGEFQGVFRPNWAALGDRHAIMQETLRSKLAGFELVDFVNVADVASESAHEYQWTNEARLQGFTSEVYAFDYRDCLEQCNVTDGGRSITGTESFVLEARQGQDHVLVTRVHPASSGQIRISVDGQEIAVRVLPDMPGQWLDLATFISAESIQSSEVIVTIQAEVPDGHYMPYYHRLYAGTFEDAPQPENAHASFQDGHIILQDFTIRQEDDQLFVNLQWWSDGAAVGDYITFVHLYDDLNQPPVAQVDTRSGNGTLPPGNWLSGTLSDDFVVDLSQLTQTVETSQEFTLAVGFYDARTLERLEPILIDKADALRVVDGRLVVGQIELGSQ